MYAYDEKGVSGMTVGEKEVLFCKKRIRRRNGNIQYEQGKVCGVCLRRLGHDVHNA